MSTVPGESTWVDAGLIPPDPDEAREATDDVRAADHVAVSRPDLSDQAAEPDVVEQALEVDDADEDDYPEG
ncbi:hypothetical protein Q6348_06835 [Isoptericola sp. b441]|uniref:Uncharacterized protein n=1 Tax=Actinotalea lenta TaxID=3064654 RepID=A0ABT9D7S0_9CELL|nr:MULTISPECIES: hypothetical protein [unclassified Isoptericola]MDO8106912.1 hypothetical protein [Isoptericola sp. b441]MDO8121377.1 hypothetical protein [Isoptericola sp. b490]